MLLKFLLDRFQNLVSGFGKFYQGVSSFAQVITCTVGRTDTGHIIIQKPNMIIILIWKTPTLFPLLLEVTNNRYVNKTIIIIFQMQLSYPLLHQHKILLQLMRRVCRPSSQTSENVRWFSEFCLLRSTILVANLIYTFVGYNFYNLATCRRRLS